jgi:hypothetical protein
MNLVLNQSVHSFNKDLLQLSLLIVYLLILVLIVCVNQLIELLTQSTLLN